MQAEEIKTLEKALNEAVIDAAYSFENCPAANAVSSSLAVVISVLRESSISDLVPTGWLEEALDKGCAVSELVSAVTCGRYASPGQWQANMKQPNEPSDIQLIWKSYIEAYRTNGIGAYVGEAHGLSAVSELLGIDSAVSAYFDGVPVMDVIA